MPWASRAPHRGPSQYSVKHRSYYGVQKGNANGMTLLTLTDNGGTWQTSSSRGTSRDHALSTRPRPSTHKELQKKWSVTLSQRFERDNANRVGS